MAIPGPSSVPTMPKPKKRPKTKADWTWEDEMLMYDVTSKEGESDYLILFPVDEVKQALIVLFQPRKRSV
jgi:hypothetical protein